MAKTILLVLTNGNYDIDEEAAARVHAALSEEHVYVNLDIDLFSEGTRSASTIAVRHIVALIEYERPNLAGWSSGKIRALESAKSLSQERDRG